MDALNFINKLVFVNLLRGIGLQIKAIYLFVGLEGEFRVIFTDGPDAAFTTSGIASNAYISTMKDDPVMHFVHELPGGIGDQLLLGGIGGFGAGG